MIIYQIPRTSNLTYDHIVGVIDCSGSMAPHWKILASHWNKYIPKDKAITITFDTLAQEVESNVLDPNINYHGGGGTSIAAAFKLAEQRLAFIPAEKNILILFVSDGQDNSAVMLEKQLARLKGVQQKQRVDFICLGIGKDFPTFVAMRLRKLYHRGEDSIPAIFLIEFASEQAFTNKFESLRPYFDCNRPRIVNPKVCLFPWRENTENVFENSWVISDSQKLILDGQQVVEPTKNYFDGIPELFRSWGQTMHLDILHEGESVVVRARKTLQMMKDILEDVNCREGAEIFKFDGVSLEIGGGDLTTAKAEERNFKTQVFKNMMKRQYARLKWFFDDVKNIAEGRVKTQEDQFEVAKLIGLGTIFGGYNQRILRLKHITVDDYLKFREEFKKIYKNTKLNPNSGQERSIVMLQNQKDLFLESDFLEGLDLCRNQIDLFESLPLVGQGLRVSRSEVASTNPYFIAVNSVAKTNATVDTTYINANQGVVRIATGAEEAETINTVLPLLGPEDEDLSPLLNSKLFNLAMSFNVLKNADCLFDEAFLALLANTLVYLLNEEKESEWRAGLLAKIVSTTDIILKGRPDMQMQIQQLTSNPLSFVRNDKDQKCNSAIDLSKSILLLFVLAESKKIDGDTVQKIIFDLFLLLSETRYLVEKKEIVELLENSARDPEQEKEELGKIVAWVNSKFKEFFSTGDLDRCLQKQIQRHIVSHTVALKVEKLEKVLTGKVSFELLNKLHFRYLNAKLPEVMVINAIMTLTVDQKTDLISRAGAAKPNEGLRLAFFKLVNPKVEKKKSSKDSVKSSKYYKLLLPKLRDDFCSYFEKVHYEVLPIPLKKIQAELATRGIKEKVLINDHSYLPRNACTAPNCKYYLTPVKYISHHFYIVQNKFPRHFHATVRQHYNESEEDIYEVLQKIEGAGLPAGQLWSEKFHRSKPDTLGYISRVKKAYKELLG